MPKLKAHPYAELFPMMTAAELEALAADIAEQGLLQPVVRYQGQVLDGRNRLLACEKAGREPTFTDYEGDDAGALALVISLNAQRRDLTAAQRAIVAARRWGLSGYSQGGRPTRGEKPVKSLLVSLDSVSKEFKVSRPSVTQARDILARAPDLAAQVEACALSLAAAYDLLQQREREAVSRSKQAERAREFEEAIDRGEMTLDEALRKIQERAEQEKREVMAQADARQTWLKGLVGVLDWLKDFVSKRTDEDLPWFTVPDAPGSFNHGVTAQRIDSAIAQLTRIRTFALENRHADDTGSKKHAGRPASR